MDVYSDLVWKVGQSYVSSYIYIEKINNRKSRPSVQPFIFKDSIEMDYAEADVFLAEGKKH